MTKLICQLLYSPRTWWDSKYYIWSGEYLVRAQITFPFHIFCFPWLRLWEETCGRKVVGSNPSTVYWMDIFHNNLQQNFVCLKIPKINEEKVEEGPWTIYVRAISTNFYVMGQTGLFFVYFRPFLYAIF